MAQHIAPAMAAAAHNRMGISDHHLFGEGGGWVQRHRTLEQGVAGVQQPDQHRARLGDIDANRRFGIINREVDDDFTGGVFSAANALKGHKDLREALLFARHEPGKIRLVIGVRATHQLNVGTIRVGQLAIPGLAKVAGAPGPLLFARDDMVVGDVHHARLDTVVITADKVKVGMIGHVGGRNRDILVARNIGAWRVVHFVVSAGGNRKIGDGPLAMIHHRVDIGREDRLVVIVDMDRRVGPPEEGLRLAGAVVKLHINFQIGAVGVEPEAVHTLGVKHNLQLGTPDRFAAICPFLNAPIDG